MFLAARSIAVFVTTVAACAAAHAGTFNRVTVAGQPVRIASHATWNADCIGGPALVEVVIPPIHGKLVGAEKPTTITRIEAGGAACRGHRIKAKAVIYKPVPGFRGEDQFAYTSTTHNGTVPATSGHRSSALNRPSD